MPNTHSSVNRDIFILYTKTCNHLLLLLLVARLLLLVGVLVARRQDETLRGQLLYLFLGERH